MQTRHEGVGEENDRETERSMKWKAKVLGTFDQTFEISVVNDSITEAQRYYGWFDENKILVSTSGGPCAYRVPVRVWLKLVEVANEVAEELNATEKDNHFHKRGEQIIGFMTTEDKEE